MACSASGVSWMGPMESDKVAVVCSASGAVTSLLDAEYQCIWR